MSRSRIASGLVLLVFLFGDVSSRELPQTPPVTAAEVTQLLVDDVFEIAVVAAKILVDQHPESWVSHLLYGRALQNAGFYREAEPVLSRAITLAQDDKNGLSFAYAFRGAVRHELGEYAEAIEDFSRALELKPEAGEVYARRSLAYAGSGESAKAREDRLRAEEVGRGQDDGLFDMQTLHEEIGTIALPR